jgi:hypothetical protein
LFIKYFQKFYLKNNSSVNKNYLKLVEKISHEENTKYIKKCNELFEPLSNDSTKLSISNFSNMKKFNEAKIGSELTLDIEKFSIPTNFESRSIKISNSDANIFSKNNLNFNLKKKLKIKLTEDIEKISNDELVSTQEGESPHVNKKFVRKDGPKINLNQHYSQKKLINGFKLKIDDLKISDKDKDKEKDTINFPNSSRDNFTSKNFYKIKLTPTMKKFESKILISKDTNTHIKPSNYSNSSKSITIKEFKLNQITASPKLVGRNKNSDKFDFNNIKNNNSTVSKLNNYIKNQISSNKDNLNKKSLKKLTLALNSPKQINLLPKIEAFKLSHVSSCKNLPLYSVIFNKTGN